MTNFIGVQAISPVMMRRRRRAVPASRRRLADRDPAAADIAAIFRHLHWLSQRGLSPGTIDQRRRFLARLRAALPVPLLEADAAILADWRASLRLSPVAINNAVSHARQFYRWAHKAGLIPADPSADIPVPRRHRRLPRPISEGDLMTALDAAPQPIRLWLVLAGWAGLRAQEIAWLRREAIYDHSDPPMLIVVTQSAKGGHERVVPLAPFVLAELAVAWLPAKGWAFPRPDGKPGPVSPWMVSHYASRALHQAGSAATLHQLRHRFATQLYHGTHDLRLVQELLGHASPHETAGYAAWDRINASPAVNALPIPGAGAIDTAEKHTRP